MICNIGFGFLAAIFSASAGAEEATWSVGLSSNRTLIEAEGFKNSDKSARTIIIIAGMQGPSPSSAILSELYKSYLDLNASESQPNLIIIPRANPQNERLVFPPQGDAYRENSVAHSLWRWLGIQAPDLVVLLDDDSNLNSALENNPVAGIGEIPAITFSAQSLSLDWLRQQGSLPVSAAKKEITRRRARTPAALVTQLAQYYGQCANSRCSGYSTCTVLWSRFFQPCLCSWYGSHWQNANGRGSSCRSVGEFLYRW